MRSSLYVMLISLPIFFFNGCGEPDLPKDQYNLEECREELLEANDFKSEGSIDHIIVEKAERKMYLYKGNETVGVLPVSLGKNPVGHKQRQGDNRTPEGEFFIHRKLCSPKYYRSLCISYPRPEDIESAKKRGVRPGGDITIHAQPKWNADGKQDAYTLSQNWTQGCVAVTNSVMEELWYAVREGVPVTIR
ncbi:MAG: L,D-transpeptidase family protein [Sulfurovum sp.]|nr:L,D-transpeptidase family protein [Sulfurovum sp.]MDD3499970.1 L,D-transpeptidase family protein [Sulfurovum sp.]